VTGGDEWVRSEEKASLAHRSTSAELAQMRLVILTSNRFGLASPCLAALCESEHCKVVGVILCRGPQASRLRALWGKLKKTRRIGLPGTLIGIYMRRFFNAHVYRTEEMEGLCARLGVPFFVSPFTNSEQTARVLRELAPDLALSIGNGYIARRIYELPRFGTVNVHLERLPEYRNARSIIWPVYFLEEQTGFTIHQVSDRIDGGDFLYRETLSIVFHSSLGATIAHTMDALIRRAPVAVRDICEDYMRFALAAQHQVGGGTYTTPTLLQFLRMVRNNRLLWQRAAQRAAKQPIRARA
jgi:methionyl-tRNA formyltransferase